MNSPVSKPNMKSEKLSIAQWAIYKMASFNYNYQTSFPYAFLFKFFKPSKVKKKNNLK